MNINIPEGRRVIRPLQVVHILCMFVFCGCQFVLLFFDQCDCFDQCDWQVGLNVHKAHSC